MKKFNKLYSEALSFKETFKAPSADEKKLRRGELAKEFDENFRRHLVDLYDIQDKLRYDSDELLDNYAQIIPAEKIHEAYNKLYEANELFDEIYRIKNKIGM